MIFISLIFNFTNSATILLGLLFLKKGITKLSNKKKENSLLMAMCGQ